MNVVDTRGKIPGVAVQNNTILTVAEVAADLRSSKAHVCNIIAGRVRGIAPLAVIRLGRRILIRRATLEEWKRLNEKVAADGILRASPEVDAADV